MFFKDDGTKVELSDSSRGAFIVGDLMAKEGITYRKIVKPVKVEILTEPRVIPATAAALYYSDGTAHDREVPAGTILVDGVSVIEQEDLDYWNSKQDQLISGDNIKTINGVPILGSGNLIIGEGGAIATDVRINDTSITSDGMANLSVDGTYNAATNKIVTESSLLTLKNEIRYSKICYHSISRRQLHPKLAKW